MRKRKRMDWEHLIETATKLIRSHQNASGKFLQRELVLTSNQMTTLHQLLLNRCIIQKVGNRWKCAPETHVSQSVLAQIPAFTSVAQKSSAHVQVMTPRAGKSPNKDKIELLQKLAALYSASTARILNDIADDVRTLESLRART